MVPSTVPVRFHNNEGVVLPTAADAGVVGKLARKKPIFVDDFKYLASLTKAVPKVTNPSPTIMHFRGGREAIDKVAYPTIEEFYDDLAASIAKKSPISPRPVAVTCRLTKPICLSLRSDAARSRQEHRRRFPTSCGTYAKLLNDTIRDAPKFRHDRLRASVPWQLRRRVGG